MNENSNLENEKSAAVNGSAEILPAESPEATALIKIEGQEIPLPFSVAAEDNLLKAALSPYYPSIKNAVITRETKDGQMTVSIVKKAEHKGQ